MRSISPSMHPWTTVLLRLVERRGVRVRLPLRLGRRATSIAFATVACLTGLVGWEIEGVLVGAEAPLAIQLSGPRALDEQWSPFEQTVEASGHLRGRDALRHAMELGLGNRTAAAQLWAGKISKQWSEAAAGDAAQPSNGTLLWPVARGRHVRGYGSGRNAYHLAIDISGERGSDVLAAAPGIVGYVGNEMSGYGNLLILVHAGSRATFYAHNQRILVVPGERVAQGQPVAVLGSTGNSLGPHVHFELVHNGRNCDPAPLFRLGSEESSISNLRPVKPAVWFADQTKPRQIRCSRRRPHPHGDENAPELASRSRSMVREPLASLGAKQRGSRSAL